jgi:hypothetical protein
MFSSALEQPGHLSAIDVEYVALDNYLPDVANVGFVKVDVEGAEIFALRGMRRLVERCRPVMIVELNEQTLVRANEHTAQQLLDTLKELRYRILDADKQVPYQMPENREKFVLANLLCSPGLSAVSAPLSASGQEMPHSPGRPGWLTADRRSLTAPASPP